MDENDALDIEDNHMTSELHLLKERKKLRMLLGENSGYTETLIDTCE